MDVGESASKGATADDLESAALALLSRYIDPEDTDMTAVAKLAGRYADVEPNGGGIMIDRAALFAAIVNYARRKSNSGSVWLLNFAILPSDRSDDKRLHDKLIQMVKSGQSIVLSRSVDEINIPTARLIATLTSQTQMIGLRHLAMALLHDPEGMHRGTKFRFSEEELRERRATFVPGKGSKNELDAWRRLINEAPTAIMASLSKPPRKNSVARRKSTKLQEPPPPPPPPPNERIKLQLGDPAHVDLLDRKPFADVLGDRINEVYTMQRGERGKGYDQAYIIHLHGPWGSGKSTILNFLRDRLENGWLVQNEPGWLVVDFNAWKYQRLRPAWWALMIQIQQAAEQQAVDLWDWCDLKWRWVWLRFRLGALSTLAVVVIFGVALMLGAISFKHLGTGSNLATALTGFGALLTTVAGIFGFGQKLITGSGASAKAQAELTDDPYGRVIRQFEALIGRIRRPIIVFVDDLDRCDAAYVGDLLDNIQTMLRSAPIVYLVAADRAWITTSFGKRYTDFTSHSENSARPLGYLFLDKLFQLSVNMPSLSGPVRTRFLNAILGSAAGAAPPTPEVIAAATEAAEAEVSRTVSQEELLAKVDSIKEETPEKQAMRVAVARRLGQTDVIAETEHRLSHLAALIEPNPRSMKNLVSAVAINQSRLVLEGRSFDLDHLARWTIIELRWPLLANWLSQLPERIDGTVTTDEPDDPINKAMLKLLAEPSVNAVAKPELNVVVLRDLIG